MLTKDDLTAIRKITREEVGSQLDERLNYALDKKLNPINKRLNRIQSDLDTAIRLLDKDIIDHRKRIERLEENSKLQQF